VAKRKLVICYGTGDERIAVVSFPLWHDLKMGGPNDEALNGHPLYEFGLQPYSIHRIDNSPWLQELERQNAVHPLHNRDRFLKSKVHYLFALKEETIECIVTERDDSPASVEVFDSPGLALRRLTNAIDA
jgi:hypothetical protein